MWEVVISDGKVDWVRSMLLCNVCNLLQTRQV